MAVYRSKAAVSGCRRVFAGLDVALRPTTEEGAWKVYFSRFCVARVALQGNPRDTEPEVSTVRDVSEHPSSMSPV